MLKNWIAWCRNRCPACKSKLEGRVGPLGWGSYCIPCNIFPWQAEKVKRQGKDRCNNCLAIVNSWGYCITCNTYPHKRWLTEEECWFLDDEDFRRKKPEEYAAMERRQNKSHVRQQLKRTDHTISRTDLVAIYGEDVVKEVEQELSQSDSSASS